MSRHPAAWLVGQGEIATRIRTSDWSQTPFGPLDAWPSTLKNAVNVMLSSAAPTMLFWGSDRRCFFNDAARRSIGRPECLAEPAAILQIDGWSALELRLRAPQVASESDGWRLCPLYGDAEELAGVLAASDEPGVRERAAVALSEERLRLGLEAGRMVTWEFDLRTGELTQSANSQSIFGGGERPDDYTARMPPEDVASDRVVLQRALAGADGLYQSEFRYNHPDGQQLHLQNWGKIVRDPAGAPIRVHGVCLDITERKRAEDALKHLNETLEHEVRTRTGRLVAAEEALRQLQKMEALGHLTSGFAHDFNNLLGSMVGSLDLIGRKANDPERVRHLAASSLKVAERGARLTSQMLTFSRGQAIELRPVRIAELVGGMRELLERSVGTQAQIVIETADDGRPVLSDETQLEMAVLNLAINARDAMPHGGTLTISTRSLQLDRDPALPPGAYCELAVRDTGTGMPPEVAALAFDPFFTTKDVGKGAGLGLSQVYGISRQAGGAVRIETEPGRGTVVRMLLPAIQETKPIASARPLTETPSHPLEIMLVDDDADLREVMVAALEELGYRVLEAADGASAMTMLEHAAPDLLIVDFAMPGMTGADLGRAARRRWPNLPIVFASGYADTGAIGDATGPATRLLRKPFRIEELQAVIAASLPAQGPTGSSGDPGCRDDDGGDEPGDG